MSDLFAAARRSALWLLAFAALGIALHVASQRLSDAPRVSAEVRAAVAAGVFPADDGAGATHFSECMSLSILLGEETRGGPWERLVADAILWRAPEPICATLARAAQDPASVRWFSYARYWHGNLVPHRIALAYVDYASFVRGIGYAFWAAVAIYALSLWSATNWATAAILIGLALPFSDAALVATLPTHAISMAALFLGAALVTLRAKSGAAPASLAVTAFCAGAAYNYFDFLYNPALLAGLCAFGAAVAGPARFRPALWAASLAFAAALAGYGAMWIVKWIVVIPVEIATIRGLTVFELSGHMGRWSAGGERASAFGDAVRTVFGVAYDAPWKAGAIGLAAAAAAAFAWRRLAIGGFVLAAIPALLAVAVLEALSGHTLAHGPFTFRTIPFMAAATIAGWVWYAMRKTAPKPAPAAPLQPSSVAAESPAASAS